MASLFNSFKTKSLTVILGFTLLAIGGGKTYGQTSNYYSIDQTSGDITFVIGNNGSGDKEGKWHYYDANWERGRGKSGWSSPQVYDESAGKYTDSIALVSTPNVWMQNTGEAAAAYPMRVFLTNLSTISGPNIHVYGGKVIKQVKVKLRNRYRSNNRQTTNSMTLQLNNSSATSVTVTNGYTPATYESAEYTFGYEQAGDNYLEPVAHLPISFMRSALTNFSRQFANGDDEDIYADVWLEVTIGHVPQQVRYTIYDYDASTGAKEKKVKKINTDTDFKNNKYFTATTTQNVGEEPQLPDELVRVGCNYGYSIPNITYKKDEVLDIEVYFTVDISKLNFCFSRGTEYRYVLCTGDKYYAKYNSSSSSSYKWELVTDRSEAGHYILTGDPYGFLLQRVQDNSVSQVVKTVNDTKYYYWELYGAKWDGTPTETQKNVAAGAYCIKLQLDKVEANVDNDYYFFSYQEYYTKDKTYKNLAGGCLSPNPAPKIENGYAIFNNATTYKDKNNDLYVLPAEGFMQKFSPRNDNISLKYTITNQQTGSSVTHTDKSAYSNTPIDIPQTLMKPFYNYEYYTSSTYSGSPTTTVPSTYKANGGTYDIYVKETFDAPFELSNDGTDRWYYLEVNGKLLSARGYPPYPLERVDTAELTPMHLWKFTMNTDGTISLQNRWYGNGYYLCNTSGNYDDRASFDGYTGAAMREGTIASLGDKAKWELTEVVHPTLASDRELGVFGLRSMDSGGKDSYNMNLSDYQGISMMRYNNKTANLDAEACVTVVRYDPDGSGASSVATGLASGRLEGYLAEANSQVGAPYGFTEKKTASSTQETERVLTNPESYNRMTTDRYFHVRLSKKTGADSHDNKNVTLLHVKANTDTGSTWGTTPDVSLADCITRERIRAWLTKSDVIADISKLDLTDASIVFSIENTSARDDLPEAVVKMSAEGFPVNANIAVPVVRLQSERFGKAFDEGCTVTLYPYGLGRVVLMANTFDGIPKDADSGEEVRFPGDAHYKSASPMLISYRDSKVAMESAYVAPTPMYIEKADKLDIVMTCLQNDNPYYTSVNLPFDVRLEDATYGALTAYTCSQIDEKLGIVRLKKLNLTETGNVLPANTPVVLTMDEHKTTTAGKRNLYLPFAQLTQEQSTAIERHTATNKFSGTNYTFTVPMVGDGHTQAQHDAYKAFGKGSQTKLPGFYPVTRTKHVNIPANKAYTYVEPTAESEAKAASGLTFVFSEDTVDADGNATTAIDYLLTEDGIERDIVIYDMQGRRVNHPGKGIYIVNGRKVAFNDK